MGKSRKPVRRKNGAPAAERNGRDESVAQKYLSRPSPRELSRSGQIDRHAADQADRLRASGPPVRPFRELIAALRAERERQGLSLADIAERTGMDRAAIHKLEIGLNANPTYATMTRYATALGTRIEWHLKMLPKSPIGA
jgi:DNA-binding phage protein